MDSILEHLFMCAMENKKTYLNQDELRDYHATLHADEKLKEELEQLLEGESLRLFKLFAENRDEEENWNETSAFRVGLSMGLKLTFFATSEY